MMVVPFSPENSLSFRELHLSPVMPELVVGSISNQSKFIPLVVPAVTFAISSQHCMQARCDDLLADHVALTDDLGAAHETIARLEGEKAALADSVRTLAERVQKLEAFKRTLIASLQVRSKSCSRPDMRSQPPITVVYDFVDALLRAVLNVSPGAIWVFCMGTTPKRHCNALHVFSAR